MKAGTNVIELFFHCKECLNELPAEESPASWARLNVGWTPIGLQVWCMRHDLEVIHLDFMGQKVGVVAEALRGPVT